MFCQLSAIHYTWTLLTLYLLNLNGWFGHFTKRNIVLLLYYIFCYMGRSYYGKRICHTKSAIRFALVSVYHFIYLKLGVVSEILMKLCFLYCRQE